MSAIAEYYLIILRIPHIKTSFSNVAPQFTNKFNSVKIPDNLPNYLM